MWKNVIIKQILFVLYIILLDFFRLLGKWRIKLRMGGFEYLSKEKNGGSRALSKTESNSQINNRLGNRKSLELLKKETRGRSNEIRNITVTEENAPKKLPYKGKNKSADFLYGINSAYNDTIYIGKNEKTGKLLAAAAPAKKEFAHAAENKSVKSEHGDIEAETTLPFKKRCFTLSADAADQSTGIISDAVSDKRLNEQTGGIIGETLSPYSSQKDQRSVKSIEALEKSYSGSESAELHGICETARSSLVRGEQLERAEETRAKRVINSVIFRESGDDFFEFLQRKRMEENENGGNAADEIGGYSENAAPRNGRDVIE